MTDAVIVSTARTPLAKSWKGAFNMTHGAELGGHAVRAAVERAGIEDGAIEDVLMGCANPEGATGANIARQVALRASDIDMVYLTGYGFPLWRGGPMNYADTVGLWNVVQAMKKFARNPADDQAFWQPAPLLAKLAAEGKSFS